MLYILCELNIYAKMRVGRSTILTMKFNFPSEGVKIS